MNVYLNSVYLKKKKQHIEQLYFSLSKQIILLFFDSVLLFACHSREEHVVCLSS